MTSKLKCPVCNRELVLDFAGENYLCDNSNCVMDGVSMMQKRWESLIQIKEKLDDYKHNLSVKTEQHERGYAYATKTIKDLESKLEIARKALNLAKWWLGSSCIATAEKTIDKALEQTEHKVDDNEQSI